jgi:hypothetical protein
MGVKLPAEIRYSKVTRRSLYQTNPEPFLESAHSPAYARTRDSQGFSRACESVVFDYFGENVQIVQVLHV